MKLAHCLPISSAALRISVPAALTVLLAACVTPPPRTVAVPAPPPQRVFVYPANGQSPEQTERDRYECHVWAVQQTGVDPSRDNNAYERVIVQPANPPGSGTAAGAIGGAILGRHYRRTAQCRCRLGHRRCHGSHRGVGGGRQCSGAGAADPGADQSKRRRRAGAGRFLSACDRRLSAGTRLYDQLRRIGGHLAGYRSPRAVQGLKGQGIRVAFMNKTLKIALLSVSCWLGAPRSATSAAAAEEPSRARPEGRPPGARPARGSTECGAACLRRPRAGLG